MVEYKAKNAISPRDCHQGVVDLARELGGIAKDVTLVGGSILNLWTNTTPKDWDLVLFGIPFPAIQTKLEAIGLPAPMVGASFGIITTHLDDGTSVDISIPRRDNQVGKSHSDILVETDPNMTIEEEARRRDFTMNTPSMSLLSGEVFDPYGGYEDFRSGILRMTDPVLFPQDPVRAYRAIQLFSRKLAHVPGAHVDGPTWLMLLSMVESLQWEAKERILEEWKKLLLKAPKPSVGIQMMYELGIIERYYPNLMALWGTPQNPEHHPEGDVSVHSLLCVDHAASLRDQIPEAKRFAFVAAALCHDIGKPTDTITPEMIREGDPRVAERLRKMNKTDPKQVMFNAMGHATTGEPLVKEFLGRFTNHKKTLKWAGGLVREHMNPFHLREAAEAQNLPMERQVKAYRRLAGRLEKDGLTLHDLAHLSMCDACSTSTDWAVRKVNGGTPNWEHLSSQRLFDAAAIIEADAALQKPMVTGKDLIAAGARPGKWFGKAIELSFTAQLGEGRWESEGRVTDHAALVAIAMTLNPEGGDV